MFSLPGFSSSPTVVVSAGAYITIRRSCNRHSPHQH